MINFHIQIDSTFLLRTKENEVLLNEIILTSILQIFVLNYFDLKFKKE